jgi:ABC-type branched-subunit amino acid transport system substrate-binding protein
MVEANGASRELFTKGYRYLFAVLSTSDQYLTPAIDLAAEHADKLGKSPDKLKVAIVMENDPFAQDVRAGVLDDIERQGMRRVIDDQLPPELSDMSTTLSKVKALKPDVLVISGHEKGALTAVNQIKELKVYVPILAMTHCDSAQIAEKLGPDAEYTFCAQHGTNRSATKTMYSERPRTSPTSSRSPMATRRHIRLPSWQRPFTSLPTRSNGPRAWIPRRSERRLPGPSCRASMAR